MATIPIPFGCKAPADTSGQFTQNSYALTIGTTATNISTIFNSGIARAIYANAAGTLSVQRDGDVDSSGKPLLRVGYIVVAGARITGQFVSIAGTIAPTNGPASTAIAIVLET